MDEVFIFNTVSNYKYKEIYDGDKILHKKVMHLTCVSRHDFALILGIKLDSVRFDQRTSNDLNDLLLKLTAICDHLAEFFNDCEPKIRAWVMTQNPMLGMISPRQMIQMGRIEKVLKFIIDAKNGNVP